MERFPHIRKEILTIYDKIYLTVDGYELATTSGYILGMANCLITFISIALYYLVFEETDEDIELMVGNDDMIVNAPSLKAARRLQEADIELNYQLGLPYSEKSFISENNAVFFEEYLHDSFKYKECRLPLALTYGFFA